MCTWRCEDKNIKLVKAESSPAEDCSGLRNAPYPFGIVTTEHTVPTKQPGCQLRSPHHFSDTSHERVIALAHCLSHWTHFLHPARAVGPRGGGGSSWRRYWRWRGGGNTAAGVCVDTIRASEFEWEPTVALRGKRRHAPARSPRSLRHTLLLLLLTRK